MAPAANGTSTAAAIKITNRTFLRFPVRASDCVLDEGLPLMGHFICRVCFLSDRLSHRASIRSNGLKQLVIVCQARRTLASAYYHCWDKNYMKSNVINGLEETAVCEKT